MKKLSNLLLLISIFTLSLLSVQNSFAGNPQDVPLKPGTDPNASSDTSSSKHVKSRRTANNQSNSRTFIAASAFTDGEVLSIDFLTCVGTARILVLDQNGNVEYYGTVDTSSKSDFDFDCTNWTPGSHKLSISYGSINLKGDFNL